MEIAIFSNSPEVNDKIKLFIDRYFNKKKNLKFHLYSKGKRLLNDLEEGRKYNYILVDEQCCSHITMNSLLRLVPRERLISFYSHIDRRKSVTSSTKSYSLYDLYASLKNNVIAAKDDRRKIINLHISDIYYFESYYNNVYAYTKDERYLTDQRSLQHYCDLLVKQGFISIHKSILINRAHVLKASRNSYELDNGKVIYPSNKRKNNAFDIYLNGLNRE